MLFETYRIELLHSRFSSLLVTCSSGLHTSSCLNSGRQQGNAMRKVLGVSKRSKFPWGKFYFETPTLPSPQAFSKGSFEGKVSGNSRRATVLNKLFMKHVTDQMSTGQYASELLGHGIEINRVKITPDYKILKIFWIAKGTADDELIEDILKKNAGFLRHELSQLRVMGNVPMIQFVKDKQYARIVEIDNRLAVADFGEDHVPSDQVSKLKSQLELFTPLETILKDNLQKLDSEIPEDTEEAPFPLMPHNVLGLDHADILNRVKKLMKKSEALHRQSSTGTNDENWVTFKLSQSLNQDPVSYGSERLQSDAFKEFLQRRQVLKLKIKRSKNEQPDKEYVREELRERHRDYLKKFDINESIDDDYIVEDLEESH